MSKDIRQRIAVLQLRRRQSEARNMLSLISARIGEVSPEPIDAESSLKIVGKLREQLSDMRKQSELSTERYSQSKRAIAAFLSHSDSQANDIVWELYDSQGRSGFFAGPLSSAFCKACLDHGYEGIALVRANLESGVLLDVVQDDPQYGDFYEVESW